MAGWARRLDGVAARVHEEHQLLAVAQRGDRLVIGDLEHPVLAHLRVGLRHADEGLRERHGPVRRAEVEEAALRVRVRVGVRVRVRVRVRVGVRVRARVRGRG